MFNKITADAHTIAQHLFAAKAWKSWNGMSATKIKEAAKVGGQAKVKAALAVLTTLGLVGVSNPRATRNKKYILTDIGATWQRSGELPKTPTASTSEKPSAALDDAMSRIKSLSLAARTAHEEALELRRVNSELRLAAKDSVPAMLEALAIKSAKTEECCIPVPEGFVIHPTLPKLARYVKGGVKTINLAGEMGLGKTTAAEILRDGFKIPLFVQGPAGDKFELSGYKDGNGKYHATEIHRWATHKGPAILLLDEVDGNDPNALLWLNSLENGYLVFPDGVVHFGDDKIVIANSNTNGDGPTRKYAGRVAQDGAVWDRFAGQLQWCQDDATELAIAQVKMHKTMKAKTKKAKEELDAKVKVIVCASWKIRANIEKLGLDVHWSPRRTYAMAHLMLLGTPIKEAVQDVGLSKLDDHDLNNVLRNVTTS